MNNECFLEQCKPYHCHFCF